MMYKSVNINQPIDRNSMYPTKQMEVKEMRRAKMNRLLNRIEHEVNINVDKRNTLELKMFIRSLRNEINKEVKENEETLR